MQKYKSLILGTTLLSTFLIGSAIHADTTQDMYRLYNPNSGEHHYILSTKERDHLAKVGWEKEGIAHIVIKRNMKIAEMF